MAWTKSDSPRDNIISVRFSDNEMAAIQSMMKREKISKSEAVRRMTFQGGDNGISGVFAE